MASPHDELPIGVAVSTRDRAVVSVNAKLARMLGIDASDAVGKDWATFVHPHDRERCIAEWDRALARLAESTIGCRVVRPDGGIDFWRVDIAPRDDEGREWISTLADVTPQREAFLRLFMQAPAAIAIVRGPDFVYELSNEMNQRFLGGRDIVGKSFREVYPDAERSGLLAIVERVYRTGEPFVTNELAVKVVEEDGSLRDTYLAGTYQPLRDAAGNIEGVLAFAYEVTKQVEASRAKDEFLATVSHELRTPLSSILGWASLVRASPGDADAVAKGLEVIERNARSQLRLVEDILDLSRIVRGEMRIKLQTFSLATVAREVIETVSPSAHAKGITLELAGDDDPFRLVADPDRLRQVMWNLLANAVKFTPTGGTVTLALERGAGVVDIVVRDTGRGMDPTFVPQAFVPFRQADGRTSGAAGGVGLGLAIVRHIVEAHGGSVSAESEGVGRGSTFKATLPIATVARRIDETARTARYVDRVRRLDGSRILVVEDDPDGRELVELTLAREGAKVSSAADAIAALALIDEGDAGSFDLVLSDIGLPERDGYWLARTIKERLPNQSLVALTAFGRPEDVQKALDAGFAAHLTKPVDPNELIETITRLKAAR